MYHDYNWYHVVWVALRSTTMNEITASEFKAKCLKLLDELDASGLVVTKRGKPVAKVVPYKSVDFSKYIGCMEGEFEIDGDILSTGVEWNAAS